MDISMDRFIKISMHISTIYPRINAWLCSGATGWIKGGTQMDRGGNAEAMRMERGWDADGRGWNVHGTCLESGWQETSK